MARVSALAVAFVLVASRAVADPVALRCELRPYDADGHYVDPATSRASLSRTLPHDGGRGPDDNRDVDALTWVSVCPPGVKIGASSVDSLRPDGTALDGLRGVVLSTTACPTDVRPGEVCAATPPIRATVDFVDRAYPAVAARSLAAEVGGQLVVSLGTLASRTIFVGGPREAPFGDRYRGELRIHVLRASPAGDPAIGGTEEGAMRAARTEARTASMLWGQCGVHFGPEKDVRVEVVDPPPGFLLAVGCGTGLPATGGGTISFEAAGRPVRVATRAGDSPIAVAHDVAIAVRALGFRAEVSPNARVPGSVLRTADVLVRDAAGKLATLSQWGNTKLSSDPTLSACIGEVSLGDGLSHFDDLDAVSGTLEERTLVKAYADEDPTTIDVFVIPSFARTGRIGESFIDMDGSGIQNVVIVDRAAVRAGSRSYALAHELGHVLLDLPGHPDDFGVDRPWELMDADAADATAFGPRRLSREDCKRAILQSGPTAPVRLLTPWPLGSTRAKGAALSERRSP